MKRIPLSALSLALVLVASEAMAVIGRPLTPMSYAGVARRTTRRTAYAYSGAHAASAAAVGTAAVVTTLPAGCVEVVNGGAVYRKCGTTYYRPAYDGPNLVYVETEF